MSKDHYYLFHNHTRYELKPNQPYVFGRVRGDFSFAADELISRRHAIIEWRGDRLLLKDLGSTNGTKLNGGMCKEDFLNPGDEIEIGSQKVTFVYENDEEKYQDLTGHPELDDKAQASGTDTMYIENKVRTLLDDLNDPNLKEQVEDIKLLYDNKKKRLPQGESKEASQNAFIDALTGVSNRLRFDKFIESEIGRATRYESDLALLLVDIDYFKLFNKTHGSSEGDEVLQLVARILEHNCRESDSVCRFSGGAFALILPETDCKNAFIVAEKLRAKVEELSASRIQLPVTVSIGVAEFDCLKTASADELILAADQELNNAKEAGRNQVGISL